MPLRALMRRRAGGSAAGICVMRVCVRVRARARVHITHIRRREWKETEQTHPYQMSSAAAGKPWNTTRCSPTAVPLPHSLPRPGASKASVCARVRSKARAHAKLLPPCPPCWESRHEQLEVRRADEHPKQRGLGLSRSVVFVLRLVLLGREMER